MTAAVVNKKLWLIVFSSLLIGVLVCGRVPRMDGLGLIGVYLFAILWAVYAVQKHNDRA